MNAAVRAVTRMGIYVGAKVFLIYEVCPPRAPASRPAPARGTQGCHLRVPAGLRGAGGRR